MDQEHCRETISCPRCEGVRLWRSRTGVWVCHTCYPDPVHALQVLVRMAQGMDGNDQRQRDLGGRGRSPVFTN
jgi:ribosomal protein L37AE/L43A